MRYPLIGPVLLVALLSGCAPMLGDTRKPYSVAEPPTQGTAVQSLAQPWLDAGDRSGFAPLARGREALGARIDLIDAAEISVDVQAFQIEPDASVRLIAARLVQAADRGVRVRLLADDIFTTMPDSVLATLDSHPNMEVRLFSPIARSVPMPVGWLTDLPRSNRRMHNKAFIADNAIAIVGGRNLADEYFEASQSRAFVDFEILAVGPIAADISRSFDMFWNDALSLPVAALRAAAPRRGVSPDAAFLRTDDRAEGAPTSDEAAQSRVLANIQRRLSRPETAPARLVADRPDKLRVPRGRGEQLLADALRAALAKATEEVILVTPYFVPRKDDVAALAALRARGVDVTLMTNSLASTNYAIVHGGYAPDRRALLTAGVRLYEARPDLTVSRQTDQPVKLTLHTKLVVIDRRTVLVGSLNLDPRSTELNSEIGIFIESPSLAGFVADEITRVQRMQSYALRLDADGNILWEVETDNTIRRWRREPGADPWRKLLASVVLVLPFIENQL